jgi:hypothetical protein
LPIFFLNKPSRVRKLGETLKIISWIKDWNTVGVNQQVEGVRSGPFRMGGSRQVNETFSLSAYPFIKGTVS